MRAPKRRAIGTSPLEILLSTPPAASSTPGAPSKKQRATYHLPKELIEHAKDVVVALAGPPCQLTLAQLVEDALRTEIARLEREHNKGQRVPVRRAEPKTGRPIIGS